MCTVSLAWAIVAMSVLLIQAKRSHAEAAWELRSDKTLGLRGFCFGLRKEIATRKIDLSNECF